MAENKALAVNWYRRALQQGEASAAVWIGECLEHVGTAKEPVVIINADAKTSHQSVIDVMQAAQLAGLSHISFATQTPTR